MPLRWSWKVALLGLLATLFLLTAIPTAAEKPPPPPTPVPRITDDDGDRIFDDLEERLAVATPSERFDTIVVLTESLTTSRLGGLKQRIGAFEVDLQYPSINGFAANLTKGQITALARLDLVAQIEADLVATTALDESTTWFGVQKARTDFGVDGNTDGLSSYSTDDIVIAVLDTGIDTGHQDLPPSKVLAWTDLHPVGGGDPICSTPCDPNGHGSHVSSIAAGTGAASGGTYAGVAPGAALVGVRVLDKNGSGSASGINAGIQWLIDNKQRNAGTDGGDAPDAGIEVFNMSLGFLGCFGDSHSTAQLVNTAVAAGLVAVIAAGNEGPDTCTIRSPGSASSAITVGVMSDINPGAGIRFGCDAPTSNFVYGGFRLACFSSRGPTTDDRVKPDIAGPGVYINAAKAGTTSSYTNKSGTSMSSPFVAGVAALMLHADSNLAPAQVKSMLMDTAVDWGTAGKDIDYGAGRLDAFEAVRTAASATDSNISVPNHQFIWGQLPAGSGNSCSSPGSFDDYTINITDPSLPLAVTLIMPTWADVHPPGNPDGVGDTVDFDVCLFDSDNDLVASSGTASRQETVGLASAPDGPYRLLVFPWAGGSFTSDPGPYFFDISVGGSISPPVSVSLTTDGSTPFGTQGFDVTVDTTASGTNDVQTVQVSTGPADLFIKTTLFANDENTWSLGAASGADQVVWEFSTDGTSWTTFTEADALVSLSSAVPTSGTQDVYLRLTTPTMSSSTKEHTATVTIVAVAP